MSSASHRIRHLDSNGDADPGVESTFEAIRRARGRVSNLFRLVAVCPPALPPFFGLSRFVRNESRMPERLREIGILVTAVTFDVTYEIVAHTVAGRQAGLTDGEIGALKSGNWDGFDAAEKAVIHYASEVALTRDVSDETFDELASRFSEPQIVELAIVIAWYHLIAAVVQPLRLELDSDLKAERARSGDVSSDG